MRMKNTKRQLSPIELASPLGVYVPVTHTQAGGGIKARRFLINITHTFPTPHLQRPTPSPSSIHGILCSHNCSSSSGGAGSPSPIGQTQIQEASFLALHFDGSSSNPPKPRSSA